MNRDDDETTPENVLLDDNIEVASTAPPPQPQRPRSVRFLTEEENVGPTTTTTTRTRVHQRCNSNDDNDNGMRRRRKHALTERSASVARLVPHDEREARSNWTKLRHHVRRSSSSLLRGLSSSTSTSDTTTAAATSATTITAAAAAAAASSCRAHSSNSMDSPSEIAAPHYRIIAHRRRISGVPVVASSAVVVLPDDNDEPQQGAGTSSVGVASLQSTLQPNSALASASLHSWQWRRRREWWQPQHWSKTCQNAVADYLLWCFQTHFGIVTLVSYVQWLLWVTFFAIWIYIVGHVQPQCLTVLDAGDFEQAGMDFMDAVHLSWTTMSTVGYGLIAPTSGSAQERCFGINLLMALEAFTGVLFASIVSAIVFSKVVRLQAIAQVRFSDSICVRYGSGVCMPVADEPESGDVADEFREGGNDHEKKDDAAALRKVDWPCPILEFRIINLLSGEKKGEIMSASVNVVASVLQNDEETEQISQRRDSTAPTPARSTISRRSSSNSDRRMSMVGMATNTTATMVKAVATTGKRVGTAGTRAVRLGARSGTHVAKHTGVALLGAGRKATLATGSLIQLLHQHLIQKTASMDDSAFGEDNFMENDGEAAPFNSAQVEKEFEREMERMISAKFAEDLERSGLDLTALGLGRTTIAVDEGNAILAPPRIYHKLEIETDSHPFFKRVWNIRHVLNARSPLLTWKVRQMIQNNDGFWPESLNDHESIRSNLRFNDIVVSFSGSTNASGASVFAQHVYDYVDVNIGYTFANVLAKEKGRIIVDAELLNDVTEQVGGGAEPFSMVRGSSLGGSDAFAALETVKEGVVDAVGTMGTRAVAAAGHVTAATQEASGAIQVHFQGGRMG